ncbi:glycosyltransferase family 2 protein [Natroniella sulfidigena]|uniref:glycosyltransferase n=1 Tax=Natroniella sulfidigena TaxID=723921 RepID=UPI00200B3C73|nr:glycosyltransferase [Natroniella sulfidigena]MCK8817060.1 glycosyltransferase family 2 protein [Natroniella sulfidigena]
MKKNKLVAMMPVYNEADRYLEQTLEQLTRWVDEIVILDDASTDETANICQQYPKVHLFKNETRLFNQDETIVRSKLWELAVQRNPDWLLAIDADEIFSDRIIDEVGYYINQETYQAISFRLFDFWKSEEFYRVDGAWNPWHRPGSVFLARYHPEWDASWPDNVIHTGRWPLEYRNLKQIYHSDIRIKHFGWANAEDHHQKFLFYSQKDLEQYGKVQPHTKSVMALPNKVKLEEWFERKRSLKDGELVNER